MTIPKFDFAVPEGYRWLVDRGHVGFEARTPLEPWYFLEKPIDVQKQWPQGPSKSALYGFARRQDNDDIACFEVDAGVVKRIVGIHGWTSDGYVVTEPHDDIWGWLKSALDDIAEWVDREPDT